FKAQVVSSIRRAGRCGACPWHQFNPLLLLATPDGNLATVAYLGKVVAPGLGTPYHQSIRTAGCAAHPAESGAHHHVAQWLRKRCSDRHESGIVRPQSEAAALNWCCYTGVIVRPVPIEALVQHYARDRPRIVEDLSNRGRVVRCKPSSRGDRRWIGSREAEDLLNVLRW